MNKKIQIDANNDTHEDNTFYEIYKLIQPRKKKVVFQKALILFLKNGNDNLLKMLFGENLEEAKRLEKKRIPKSKKVINKKVKREKKSSIKEKFREFYSYDSSTKLTKTEVAKDDISSDEEIMNILKSHNTGSSTTQESEGALEEFKLKKQKKKEKKPKAEELSDEQKEKEAEESINRFKAEFAERAKEDEERRKSENVNWGKD